MIRIGRSFELCRETCRRRRLPGTAQVSFFSNRGGQKKTATLVLLRHGQSLWNKIPTFTGWCDVPLTPHGVEQAQETGKLLDIRGYKFDVTLTSELQRAVETCEVVLQVIDPSIPVIKAWQLNERHYGELQGRAKKDPALFAQYGEELLLAWRREFDATPPAMESSHPYYQPPPAPLTESLADCQVRVLKYWKESIVPKLTDGGQVLLVAHSNTIRALVAFLDEIIPEHVPQIHIPNSVPCVYHIDPCTGSAIHESADTPGSSKGHWLLNMENRERLVQNLGGSSESFARSIFDAWDANRDGILSKEELTNGLFMWKNSDDRALGALAGKLWEELNISSGSEPITLENFQAHAVMGCRKHNLPFFLDEE